MRCVSLDRVRVLVLACLALLLLGGCEREAPLSLLTLRDVAPHDVEVGEHVQIEGAGFPRGRVARVILSGTLHRPGAAPLTGFEARADGVVVSETSVELAYDARLQALFCGPGDSAIHTTFRGDVTVAFAAAVPGAPPASATLSGVELDLRPPPGSASAVGHMRAEGERFLEAAGIVVDRSADLPSGLAIENVRAGSAAERAGLLPGDLLVSFDGVHVRSAADVVPAPAERSAAIGIRRGGDPNERVVTLVADDYRARGALAPMLLVAVLAALAAAWLFAPSPRVMRWMARRLARKGPSPSSLGTNVVALAPLLAIPLTVALPIGLRELARGEPEMVSVALAALAAAAALHGVTCDGGVLRSLRAALGGLVALAPAVLAIFAAGIFTGAARATEASHVQGAWPWEFVATRGFAPLVVFALGAAGLALPVPEAPTFGRAARVARIGHDALVFVMATLLTVVFLGGWQSPFGAGASAFSAGLAGAVLFVAKSAGLGAGAIALRSSLETIALRKRAFFALASATAIVGAALASSFESRWTGGGDPHVVSWGLTGVAAAFVLRLAWLIADAARTPTPRLDPFS